MTCTRTILKEIKVVASLGNVNINNALTFDPLNNSLQFRGELVRDTDVWGNYALTFGTVSDKIRSFTSRTSQQTHIEYHNGVNFNSLTLNSAGILVSNTLPGAKGLQGGSDFSANYDELSFVQKIYPDTKVVGKNISSTLANPGAGQDTYSITWDNTNNRWNLTPSGNITAGTDTQVIFNSAGVLTGNSNLTFASNILTVPNINVGSITSLPGTDRTIQVISDVANTGLIIKPKGTGNLSLSLLQGSIILGDSTSTNTIHLFTANGANSNIDIGLEPKGTDGKVYIGNQNEAGGERYIKSRGNLTSVDLVLEAKGTNSTITLIPSADGDSTVGTVKIGDGNNVIFGVANRLIYADSNYQTTNLQIGGSGLDSFVKIGRPTENAPNRFFSVESNSANCNLKITAKGTGATYIDGVAAKRMSIGDWNMVSSSAVTIIPNLPGGNGKIVSVYAKIFVDGSNILAKDLNAGGSIDWDGAIIFLRRDSGGAFDNTNYDATGFNRGYIYILYEE